MIKAFLGFLVMVKRKCHVILTRCQRKSARGDKMTAKKRFLCDRIHYFFQSVYSPKERQNKNLIGYIF